MAEAWRNWTRSGSGGCAQLFMRRRRWFPWQVPVASDPLPRHVDHVSGKEPLGGDEEYYYYYAWLEDDGAQAQAQAQARGPCPARLTNAAEPWHVQLGNSLPDACRLARRLLNWDAKLLRAELSTGDVQKSAQGEGGRGERDEKDGRGGMLPSAKSPAAGRQPHRNPQHP